MRPGSMTVQRSLACAVTVAGLTGVGLALGPAIIMVFFKGPERRYLITLFLVGFAIRALAAVIAHPYLITTSKTKPDAAGRVPASF